MRKSTARWSKLHSTSTDDPAEKEEQLSWITHKFLQFFENSNVKFTEIGWNFMHRCKNCFLHVPRNNSRKIWCWGKSLLFLSLLIFHQNMTEVFAEKFGHGGQTCISRQRLTIPRKNKSLEENRKFKLFWEFERQIHGVWWKLQARSSKLHSTCTKEQFKRNLMLGKKGYCFYHFCFLIKIFSEFLRRSFGTVVKTAFHVNEWSFQERKNLSNKTESVNFFGNSSVKFTEFGESFKHGCQICILHVRRKNSRKNW